MDLSKKADAGKYAKRLMKARMKLLYDNGFYGLLAMHVNYRIGNRFDTAWIEEREDKDYIYLNPQFLDNLDDRELYYVIMHLIMHVALDHISRKNLNGSEYFDKASDIVVNSNIVHSMDDDEYSVYLGNYGGIQEYMAPNGKAGYKYSVEELCRMLESAADVRGDKNKRQTLFDMTVGVDGSDSDGSGNRNRSSDNDSDGKLSEDNCDSESMRSNGNGSGAKDDRRQKSSSGWDYHDNRHLSDRKRNINDQKWKSYIISACDTIEKRIEMGSKSCGSIPDFASRFIDEIRNPKLDWRSILNDFIQEDICDYSFTPPDRRFADSDFFLPDYNEKDEKVEKILFMIDTSASMSDKEVTECYCEIKGAIDQFDGRLQGWLGFFDARVIEPRAFSDEEEFRMIRAKGGGGTSFHPIFDYVREEMSDDLPVSIIILTDGYVLSYPEESTSMDIPVLWIINNKIATPPWGRVARLVDNN